MMDAADLLDLGTERLPEVLGQHGAPVLRALALADDQQIGGEVDVFDAQPQPFEKAKSAPLRTLGVKSGVSVLATGKRPNSVAGGPARKRPRTPRPTTASAPGRRTSKNSLLRKEQRAQAW